MNGARLLLCSHNTCVLRRLLAPGEEAFQRQQGDEDKVKNVFGKRD